MRKIFVFGSNLAGKHYGGSAKAAVEQYGAINGQGVGLQGDSYAIPTLDKKMQQMSLIEIEQYVSDFLDFAKYWKHWNFHVVAIGCGIAGFTPEQIAPMFGRVPANVQLPPEFLAAQEAA